MCIDAQNGKIDRILDDGEMPAPYGDISYDVPKMLLKNGEIAREYIERKLCTEKKILAEISAANAQNTERKKDSNAEEAALDSAESGEEIRSRLKEVKQKYCITRNCLRTEAHINDNDKRIEKSA